MFWRSFLPGYVAFSNDGPVGVAHSQWMSPYQPGLARWDDMNLIGQNAGSQSPTITFGLLWLLGPIGFAKFYPPIAIFILGMGASMFMRSLGLNLMACTLATLAAALNQSFFCPATWGVGSQEIGLSMCFLAMALMVSSNGESWWVRRWSKIVLAGFCVGLNIMEAADIGAILSVFVAAFVMINEAQVVRGATKVAVIASCALWMAFNSVWSLIQTNIIGVR